jgi:hypothetical protein
MNVPKKKKFLFDAHKAVAQAFEVNGDGRKKKHASGCRRALFVELASFADADGRGACPSYKTLANRLSYSESKVKRYIADLTKLGFFVSRGKSKFGGTVIRDLMLPSIGSDTPQPTGSDSDQSGHIDTLSGHIDPSIESSNDLRSAHLKHLPTKPPAHQPANAAEEVALEESDRNVEWVQELFEGRTGQILTTNDAASLFADRLPEAVKGTVEDWLNRRDRGGMKNPAYFLKKEFADYYNPNNQPSRDEFTNEELASFKATIDRQNEIERNEVMNRKPEPERVLSAEDLFGT